MRRILHGRDTHVRRAVPDARPALLRLVRSFKVIKADSFNQRSRDRSLLPTNVL